MAKSKIEWTDATWNPVTGCTKCSPGCLNCYAEKMAKRLAGRCGYPKENPFAVTLRPERLEQPLHWHKHRRIFVCSMSDLFHEAVPFEFIDCIMSTIHRCREHVFLILTKRVDNMQRFVKAYNYRSDDTGMKSFPKNVHLGVSISTQAEADEKIPILLQIPAAVKFLSIEPLLSKIDLTRWLETNYNNDYAESETRKPNILFSENGRISNRQTGPNLEKGEKGRTQSTGLSSDKKNDKRQALQRNGTSACLPALLGANSKGIDCEPQERNKERQQTGEFRNSNVLSANETYERRVGKKPKNLQSIRRKQSRCKINCGASQGNKDTQSKGRVTKSNSEGLQHNCSDSIRHCSKKTLGALGLIILGAESLGSRPGRECKLEWVRDLVAHCRAAGVPVFVKQLHLNGKLVKDTTKFPKDLRAREYPKGGEK